MMVFSPNKRVATLLLLLIPHCIVSFSQQRHRVPMHSAWLPRTTPRTTTLLTASKAKADEEQEDWRAFRAKLVQQERQEEHPTDASILHKSDDKDDSPSWAYESGNIVEQGSVLLNHPPTRPYKYFGYSLGMQYLHKSVMLVLEHDAHSDTSGILLNRPTDLTLQDGDFTAQIWYGGPNHGIHTLDPKFYCLHNINSPPHDDKDDMGDSRNVISGIEFTTIAHAKTLVQSGEATPSDFWVFCGFCEMDSETLVNEIEEELWHSVATDAKTLRNGLRILNAGANMDPRNAGLGTWSKLMKMIGRPAHELQETTSQENGAFDDLMLREWTTKYIVNFDDLMLHEWATKNLVFPDDATPMFLQEEEQENDVTPTMNIEPGTILRGSSNPRSPFLLQDQEYHKSLLLIIQDDDKFSVGVLLNHCTDQFVDLQMLNAGSFFEKELIYQVPLRYGGPIDLMGTQQVPLFFLHNSAKLRKYNVGEPISKDHNIWRCTPDEAADAMAKRWASPLEFMVLNGFSVWDKKNGHGGIAHEVENDNFEVVSSKKTDPIWELLLRQEHLTQETLHNNIETSKLAWSIAGGTQKQSDGCAENPDVFKSKIKVSDLSDDAFKVWTAAFFLDDPTLRP